MIFFNLISLGKQQYINYSVIVETAGLNLYEGVFYRIKSRWGTVLDNWGGKTGPAELSLMPDDFKGSANWMWTILKTNEEGWFKIKSVNGTLIDDWGGVVDQDAASLMNDLKDNNNNQKWKIEAVDGTKVFPSEPDHWFKIKSYHGVVLDSWGGKTGEKSAALQHDEFPNENQIWRFFPDLEAAYQIKIIVQKFVYNSDIIKLLNDNKKMEMIQEQIIIVDQNTTGSSVSFTFSKSFINTFSWGLKEKLSCNYKIGFQGGVPLLAEASGEFSFSAHFSANQQWTSQTNSEISASATLNPKSPGTYSSRGFVYMVENMEFPFQATAFVTVNGYRIRTDGIFDENVQINEFGMRQILDLSSFPNYKFVLDSLNYNVSGTIKGTYGLSTCTQFQTIISK